MTTANTIKNTQDKLQTIAEITRGTSSTNDAYQLAIFGLVLFILGLWLAIVVDVFILLDSRFSRNLMAVGGEVAVLLSHWC
jgi:hypothetical protein